VLVGKVRSIPTTETIHLANKPESFTDQFETESFPFLFLSRQRGVQLSAGKDPFISDTKLLDFFEVEEAFAVGQCMQGHDADWRAVGIEDGEGDHGCYSGEISASWSDVGQVERETSSRFPVAYRVPAEPT
jgi:hypothetical protein